MLLPVAQRSGRVVDGSPAVRTSRTVTRDLVPYFFHARARATLALGDARLTTATNDDPAAVRAPRWHGGPARAACVRLPGYPYAPVRRSVGTGRIGLHPKS